MINLNLYNVFHGSQHGFEKHYSTELAAMELMDRKTQYMNWG